MSLSDRKPMRACGKLYASVEEASRSKAVTVNGHEVVTGCPCGGVHTSPKREKPKAALSLRPQGRDDGPSPKVRKLVLERDGYACVRCGKTILGQRYSLAHRVRASQGGKAVPENLVTLHGWGAESCHGEVDLYKDRADGQDAKGYRLPSGADPAAEPVLIVSEHGSGALVWLTPDGTYATEPPSLAAQTDRQIAAARAARGRDTLRIRVITPVAAEAAALMREEFGEGAPLAGRVLAAASGQWLDMAEKLIAGGAHPVRVVGLLADLMALAAEELCREGAGS